MRGPFWKQGTRTALPPRPSRDFCFSGTDKTARGPCDRKRSYFWKGRPRATAHRRTRPAAARRRRPRKGPRSGPQLELARLVQQQPTLGLDEIAIGRMGEAADAVRGDHPVAGND